MDCSEPGCDRPAQARGLCKTCYSRRWKRGTLPPRVYESTALRRFEQYCDKGATGGHWLWTGTTNDNGYAVMYDRGQTYVHRWAYQNFVGPIPDGMVVGHHCHDLDLNCRGGECIHRRCVNPDPDHLVAMTQRDNTLGGRAPSRKREFGALRRAERTHCIHGHRLTEANIYYRPEDDAPCCRECRKVYLERSRAKKRTQDKRG